MKQSYQKETSANLEMLSNISEVGSSIGSFFTISYGIILTLSISYNIGYFKYLQPQIVDLMTLGDYINDTIHNTWFFLIAGLVFFASSLAVSKDQSSKLFNKICSFAIFTFLITIYSFIQGIEYSKFWPTIKILIITPELMFLFIALIFISLIILTFIVYRFSHKIIKSDIPSYFISVMPVVIFLFLVLAPYLVGMVHSYIENHFLERKDYSNVQLVDIETIPQKELLANVIILKKIDKGLIVKQFKNNDQEVNRQFYFLNWGSINKINYHE